MKRLIAAGILAVITLICCISGVSITRNCADRISVLADECIQSYTVSQKESLKKAQLLKKKIVKYQPFLFMFSNRETVEELEDAVSKMEYSIDSGNYIQLIEEYYNANTSIRKLKEAQRLSIESFL